MNSLLSLLLIVGKHIFSCCLFVCCISVLLVVVFEFLMYLFSFFFFKFLQKVGHLKKIEAVSNEVFQELRAQHSFHYLTYMYNTEEGKPVTRSLRKKIYNY